LSSGEAGNVTDVVEVLGLRVITFDNLLSWRYVRVIESKGYRRLSLTESFQTVSNETRVTVGDVIGLMGAKYGPIEPRPRTDPATALVSTVLSQHTSDVNSARAFDNLMKVFGSLEGVADARVEDVERAIRVGGLARIKAPRIRAILRQVRDDVGSFDLSFLGGMALPDAKAWLTAYKGIGPKTAAVILCFALGIPAMPVDTHVFRVARRLGFIDKGISPERAHDVLEAIVPPTDVFAFHMYLIRHGRDTCKALRPRCGQCVLAQGCPSHVVFDRAAGET